MPRWNACHDAMHAKTEFREERLSLLESLSLRRPLFGHSHLYLSSKGETPPFLLLLLLPLLFLLSDEAP